jgi:hypothetical protein
MTETIPKRRAIAVVLREAWAHNRYMERDLEALATSTEAKPQGT